MADQLLPGFSYCWGFDTKQNNMHCCTSLALLQVILRSSLPPAVKLAKSNTFSIFMLLQLRPSHLATTTVYARATRSDLWSDQHAAAVAAVS